MRRTRFVCVSDTHNGGADGAFKLPKGDVLIHAGDLTNQGSFSELQKAVKWIEDADFESKIVIAGNHDITLDSTFYDQYGQYFHSQDAQDAKKCQKLLEESPSIVYLKHESAVVKLTSPKGPQTTFKIFGSPYSPASGRWAFGYSTEEANTIWTEIPLDSDIILTHTPPKYHLDERADRRAVGCEQLRAALWRVRPKLSICGHVHESRGAEVVKWDLEALNVKYKESGTTKWIDPGKDNKKLSLLDLTRKRGSRLLNDDSMGDSNPGGIASVQSHAGNPDPLCTGITFSDPLVTCDLSSLGASTQSTVGNGLLRMMTNLLEFPNGSVSSATRGQGGQPPSGRCDLEALSGRLGRKETCIVNAAMMLTSWPHKQQGGKKYNKPIVIDIDLPEWSAL